MTMNLSSITKAFAARITKALDNTHGVLFSAADLSDAMKVYKHAQNGEHYHPDLGVYGTFDPKTDAGASVIDAAKAKLMNAKGAYDKTFSRHGEMLSSDRIMDDELGMTI